MYGDVFQQYKLGITTSKKRLVNFGFDRVAGW